MPSDIYGDDSWMRDAKIFHLGTLEEGLDDDEDVTEDKVAVYDGDGKVISEDDLFLSLGEMYFALMMQSLQSDDLDRWLPKDAPRDHASRGVNIALPLYQSFSQMAKFGMAKLCKSPDPEVRAYAYGVLANNRAKIIADNYRQNIIRLRQIGKWARLFRDVFERGQEVRVYCFDCHTESVDHWPRYLLRTGEYICRLMGCANCPLTARDKKEKCARSRRRHDPVNLSLAKLPQATMYSRLEKRSHKEHWLQYWSFERDDPPVLQR